MAGDKQIPFRARLHWYRFTPAEFCLVTAMLEHCSDGSTVWPSMQRLAGYSKLSIRQIFNLFHGYKKPDGEHVPGLIEKGILTEIAPSNPAKRRPATYRVNEQAMVVDPAMIPYLTKEQQETLPGIYVAPVPGERVKPRQKTLPGMRPAGPSQRTLKGLIPPATIAGVAESTPATIADAPPLYLRQPLPESPATVADDSRFDSRLTKPLIHHAESGALSLPAWKAIKDMLRREMTPEEWSLIVRPMRLLRVMAGNTLQIAIPPNGQIEAAAVEKYELLRECSKRAGFSGAVLTKYPDGWQREQLQERFPDYAPIDWQGARA